LALGSEVEMHLPLQISSLHGEYRKILFSGAFAVIEGPAYNQVAGELRDQARGSLFVLYEVVLETYHSWDYLKARVYPSLSRYLRYKSLDPGTAEGLVVSLFFKDHFYLIRGPEFIRAFCEIEGIDENSYNDYVARWLSVASL
jgi:hypothetical protein